MKIIFSRKGFDASSGGYPSPIFPNGNCYSIPIPGKFNNKKYNELQFEYKGDSIQKILNDLTSKHIKVKGKAKICDYYNGKFSCHHDPLLIKNEKDAIFTIGQADSALGHLRNQDVKAGDIFLFYGLLREVEKYNGVWSYKKGSKTIHLIFAYMKIDEIIDIIDKNAILKQYPCLGKHPHLDDAFMIRHINKNSIFIGREYKILDYDEKRVLTDTKPYKSTSKWKLPISFDFSQYMSFIKNIDIKDNNAYLQHRGYGQEFVLNIDRMLKSEQDQFYKYLNSIIF